MGKLDLRSSWAARYGTTVVAVGLTLLLQLLLASWFGGHPNLSPFMTFFVAVMVASWFGGLGMGLLATALSALLSWYFFLSPQYSFAINTLEHGLRLFLFVLEGVVISALVEAMHRARRRAERALKAKSQAEDKYRSIFENAVDGIFQTSLDGRILTANPAAARILGYKSPEELMSSVSDIGRQLYIDPDDWTRYLRLIQQQGIASDSEDRLYRKDGSMIWVSISARALRDGSGDLAGYEGVMEDITDRKQAKEALKDQQEFLRLVIDTNPNLIFVKDWDGKFTFANKSVADIYGTAVEDLLGKSDADFNSNKEEVEAFLKADREVMETLQSMCIPEEPVTNSRTGEVRWFQTIKVPLEPSTDGSRRVLGVSTDITARKEAVSALSEVREAERRQIARDLHDEALQELTDVLYSMEVWRLRLGEESEYLTEIRLQIDHLRGATQTLRDTLKSLRQDNIQEQPFVHLLTCVVAANRRKAPEMEISLSLAPSFSLEPSESTGINLLRIIQEALVNVRRHSGAQRVCVNLWAEGVYLNVEVVDDGRGFDMEIDPEATWGRVGIATMRERALNLGGDLDIQSEPGKGARVRARIPAPTVLAADDLAFRVFRSVQ
jgi:PAS domain S-box-containing protein